jgi:hypothetical protein
MVNIPRPVWRSPQGEVVACVEKLKVLRENGSKFADVDDSQMGYALRARQPVRGHRPLRHRQPSTPKMKALPDCIDAPAATLSSPEHPLLAEICRGSQRFPQSRIRTPAS